MSVWKPKGKSQKPLGKSRRRVSSRPCSRENRNTSKHCEEDRGYYTKNEDWSSRNTPQGSEKAVHILGESTLKMLSWQRLVFFICKESLKTIRKRYLIETRQVTWTGTSQKRISKQPVQNTSSILFTGKYRLKLQWTVSEMAKVKHSRRVDQWKWERKEPCSPAGGGVKQSLWKTVWYHITEGSWTLWPSWPTRAWPNLAHLRETCMETFLTTFFVTRELETARIVTIGGVYKLGSMNTGEYAPWHRKWLHWVSIVNLADSTRK